MNLRFGDHGMVFILGKSGSGKSTLLNIIGGLDQADSGELMIHQKSTKQFSQADYDAYRNTYIGFIFQEFYLIEEYTIEHLLSIQRHNVDQDGNIYIEWNNRLNEITKANAVKIMNTIPNKTAKVYDSTKYQFTSQTMGINVKERNVYFDSGLDHFYLTEANAFSDIGYEQKDIIGQFPKNSQELAITAYLADMIMEYGIYDETGKLIKPKNETELLEKVKLPILDQWIQVSGIVKEKDYLDYAYLKTIAEGQMKEEEYKLFRKFNAMVRQNSSYIYVKDGFVDKIQPKKDNILYRDNYDLIYSGDQLKKGYEMYGQRLAYPNKEISYFDGSKIQTVDHLKSNEVIWSVWE